MSTLHTSAQASFNAKLSLIDSLRQGGNWLAACRNWLQNNVPKGDTLHWNSGELVSIPFHRFEELSLKVATAAILEDRAKNPGGGIGWNTDISLIADGDVVLCKLTLHKYPVMCMRRGDDISLMLDQDYYGMHIEPNLIEKWINPSTLATL